MTCPGYDFMTISKYRKVPKRIKFITQSNSYSKFVTCGEDRTAEQTPHWSCQQASDLVFSTSEKFEWIVQTYLNLFDTQ